MNCKECDYYFLKNTKDRPIFCCRCEISYHWRKMIPDLPLYTLLAKVLDRLTEFLVWVEKKIKG